MPKNDIGGFFVSLGLNPDKNSFETGNKLIDAVSTSLNKLIGTARNAAVALTGTAIVTGAVEQSTLKTSTAIGVSVDALNTWGAAAKITGVNVSGLIGSMGKLSNVMNHMTIDGSGLEAYADQLWKLGLGFEELEELSPDEAFKKIFEAAQGLLDGGMNETEVAMRVQDVLGEDAMNFFIEMNRQGLTIAELLSNAGKTVFTTEEDAQKSADFKVQVDTLKAEVESIGKLIGSEAAGILTPYVDDVNKWLQGHGDEIRSTVEEIFSTTEKVIGKAVDKIGTWWENHGDEIADTLKTILTRVEAITLKVVGILQNVAESETVQNIGKATVEAVMDAGEASVELAKAIIDKDTGAAVEAIEKGLAASVAPINVVEKEMAKSENETINAIGNQSLDQAVMGIINDVGDAIVNGAEKVWNWITGKNKKDKKNKNVDDGILRPDGTITEVAPDDWVFAARNVSDLARAFIPQAQALPVSANQEYTINQTFNIQGGVNDIPAVIKQQAYRGTQDALLLAMQQSSSRLQQMSGTR